MPWKVDLGRLIAEARQELGLTQEDLAVAAKITPRTLINYETGRRAPNVDTLRRIAQSVGKTEFALDGYRIVIQLTPEPEKPKAAEQLRLEYDKEHVFHGATLKIRPGHTVIVISTEARTARNRAAMSGR